MEKKEEQETVKIPPEFKEIIEGYRFMDDDFFNEALSGNEEALQQILRIVLDMPDLVVDKAFTQFRISRMVDRSIVLDTLAHNDESFFNVEISRESFPEKRARAHSSVIDSKCLEKGDDFKDMLDSYVIIITEKDPYGYGCPLYYVDRFVSSTPDKDGILQKSQDGGHIIYVNGAYRGPDPIGRLMEDFFQTESEKINNPVLRETMHFYKETQEGVDKMSDALSKLVHEREEVARAEALQEGRTEERKATAKRAYNAGITDLEQISNLSSLPIDEVRTVLFN